jgi:hypothetical protein
VSRPSAEFRPSAAPTTDIAPLRALFALVGYGPPARRRIAKIAVCKSCVNRPQIGAVEHLTKIHHRLYVMQPNNRQERERVVFFQTGHIAGEHDTISGYGRDER